MVHPVIVEYFLSDINICIALDFKICFITFHFFNSNFFSVMLSLGGIPRQETNPSDEYFFVVCTVITRKL